MSQEKKKKATEKNTQHPPEKKKTDKHSDRHFIQTSRECHLRLCWSWLPLYYLFTDARPVEKQPLGMPSKLNTHLQQTEKVFTEPPSLFFLPHCLNGVF